MHLVPVTLLFVLVMFSGCGLGKAVMNDSDLDISGEDSGKLENRSYGTAPGGETILFVEPNVNSRDELAAYREFKIAEAAQILELTKAQGEDRPYYPAFITFAKPLSIAELNELITRYDPSVQKALAAHGASKSANLLKANLVKGEDALLIHSVRFNSTVGGGQLAYETMADSEGLSKLEEGIASQERELNGLSDYQLIAGITSIAGGVHRDSVLTINDDPQVFLADIGPQDLYEGKVAYARWDDVSELVEKYLSH